MGTALARGALALGPSFGGAEGFVVDAIRVATALDAIAESEEAFLIEDWRNGPRLSIDDYREQSLPQVVLQGLGHHRDVSADRSAMRIRAGLPHSMCLLHHLLS